MPVSCPIPLRFLSQEEFGELSFEVMRDVFAIHNSLGRLFDESIYKHALAARRRDVMLEFPIDVSFGSFSKRYFMDVLAQGGGVFEFKAVDGIAPRHKAQLIHYLLLTGLKHGMLVNLRGDQVEREFVNASLTLEDRRCFSVETGAWTDSVSGASRMRETLLAILNDWGTCLELPLYNEALTHLLGGEANVLRMTEIRLEGVSVGSQLFRQVSDGVAFKLTAFEAEESLERFAAAARRMLACASLQALLWVNIARHRITFVTLQ